MNPNLAAVLGLRQMMLAANASFTFDAPSTAFLTPGVFSATLVSSSGNTQRYTVINQRGCEADLIVTGNPVSLITSVTLATTAGQASPVGWLTGNACFVPVPGYNP